VTTIDSKYSKYSTEQLEVILTHLADPDEKELVKKELSQRYYSHYLSIIETPEPRSQTPTLSAAKDLSSPLPPEVSPDDDAPTGGDHIPCTTNGQAPGSLPFDEALSQIPEVTPIKPALPASAETPPEPGKTDAPDKAAKKRFCFIATAAYGSPLAQEVVLLQNFRDSCLSRTSLGRQFVRAYYRSSPYLAAQIRKYNTLKLLTKIILAPIILLLTKRSGSHRPSLSSHDHRNPRGWAGNIAAPQGN